MRIAQSPLERATNVSARSRRDEDDGQRPSARRAASERASHDPTDEPASKGDIRGANILVADELTGCTAAALEQPPYCLAKAYSLHA